MKINYLFTIFFCFLLKLATAQDSLKVNEPTPTGDLASAMNTTSTYTDYTWGKISGGKFYTYSVAPNVTYPDKGRKTGIYTDGIQITDEQFGTTSPTSDNWVGWYNTQFEIVLDLGKFYAVSLIQLHALSNTAWGIKFPKTLQISTQNETGTWVNYAIQTAFPSNSSSSTAAFSKGEGWVNTRYVKFKMTADANIHTFIDEIEVYGSIGHSRKYIPGDDTCYHGAYTVNAIHDMDANAACIINFETKAQRKLKMVLWYEVMNDGFPYSQWVTQKLINEAFVAYNTNNPHPSQFIIELGTQISNMTAEQIAMGDGDSIATIWFTQCRDSNFPTFIRLLSEMNHPGTYANDPENTGANKWGGTPTTYIQAWRRWYNIAERLNATGNKQVFVWSPHAKEDYRYHSSSPQRNMENYYPGHQYVDWVGASVYNNDSTAIVSVYDQLTRISALYGSVKPLMISEGAMQETNQADEKYNFILDWWNAINLLDIKAAVWFNDKPVGTTQEFKIDSSPASLRAYRPYLIPR